MSILDMVQEHLGAGQVQQISQQIGADPQQTQTAVQAALPMLLSGMAGAAQQPGGGGLMDALGGLGGGGAQGLGGGLGGALGGMLGGSGGGSGLAGAIGGMLGGGGGGAGGILGSILGQHTGTVEDGVAQASGLNGDQTRKLLMILAPIVLGMIAKRHAQAGGNLGGALQQDAQEAQAHAERQHPQMGGILGSILSKVQTGR